MARAGDSDLLHTGLLIVGGMFLWNKLSGVADKVGKRLEIGENSGGVLQSETTEQIDVYEAEVKTWHCDWAALGNRKTACKAIANKIYTHVKDHAGYTSNIDEDYLIGLCKPLSSNELRAVAILFGVKDLNNFFGFTVWTGHIFHLFDSILTDSYVGGNDMSKMKEIWSKTGLWV
jgi:hypothetical protein